MRHITGLQSSFPVSGLVRHRSVMMSPCLSRWRSDLRVWIVYLWLLNTLLFTACFTRARAILDSTACPWTPEGCMSLFF